MQHTMLRCITVAATVMTVVMAPAPWFENSTLAPPHRARAVPSDCATLPAVDGVGTAAPQGALRRLHVVHVPNAAGTSFGRVLRVVACHINNKSAALDCCLDGGASERDNRFCSGSGCRPPGCAALINCDYCGDCRPTPQLSRYLQPGPPDQPRLRDVSEGSVTMLRHPLSRLLSSYYYHRRGGARGVASVARAAGRGPSRPFSFEEFVARPENQNVMTRMLARDTFPYSAAAAAAPRASFADLRVAKEALRRFRLVAIAEAFPLAVRLLGKMFGAEVSKRAMHEA